MIFWHFPGNLKSYLAHQEVERKENKDFKITSTFLRKWREVWSIIKLWSISNNSVEILSQFVTSICFQYIHHGENGAHTYNPFYFPFPPFCLLHHQVPFPSFQRTNSMNHWSFVLLFNDNSTSFVLICVIHFLLLASDLKYSCLSRSLSCIIRLFIWHFSILFMCTFTAINIPCRLAFLVSYRFCFLYLYYHLIPETFFISLLIFSMIHWLFNSVFFNFHVFVYILWSYFLIFLVLLIS